MTHLYQFLDDEGNFTGIYISEESQEDVQMLVTDFYHKRRIERLDDYLEERNIFVVLPEFIDDF